MITETALLGGFLFDKYYSFEQQSLSKERPLYVYSDGMGNSERRVHFKNIGM
ncbi:hypothetical protein J2786_003013 [Chryseobacterium vietnamense]|uniref:Uncharacterized protein n=1 Tax=Chryseobacterium vietnamense TaxID=866785 RepID=A0ACC6J9Z3_9FLAO|nr:hypothetical protein [Chryseobacterium vietnamense]